jgi:hypothetical protein
MNRSRPRSWRVSPSFASSFSMTFCVAIPAWSSPGSQSVGSPCIRCHRTSASVIASSSPCPRCSSPVTFGGGMMMQYGSRFGSIRGWK